MITIRDLLFYPKLDLNCVIVRKITSNLLLGAVDGKVKFSFTSTRPFSIITAFLISQKGRGGW